MVIDFLTKRDEKAAAEKRAAEIHTRIIQSIGSPEIVAKIENTSLKQELTKIIYESEKLNGRRD